MERPLSELLVRLEGRELEDVAWDARHLLQQRVAEARAVLTSSNVTHGWRRLVRPFLYLIAVLAAVGLTFAVLDAWVQARPLESALGQLQSSPDPGVPVTETLLEIIYNLLGFPAVRLFWPSLIALLGVFVSVRLMLGRLPVLEELRRETDEASEILKALDYALAQEQQDE